MEGVLDSSEPTTWLLRELRLRLAYMSRLDERSARLRRRVLRELRGMGFRTISGVLIPPDLSAKQAVRELHYRQRVSLLNRNAEFLEAWEKPLISHFASGAEVRVDSITPEVELVSTTEQAALFRYATLFWSVPVSQGFGRRTRFLVRDRENGKLIGLFALGDPVYNLTARDQVIGWDVAQRNERLYNVLDAFILGAVPPYRALLGGKLVAMAAVSEQAQSFIERKYRGTITKIQKVTKRPRPVLITTSSALGRSSLYNRLRYRDRLLYVPVGYSKGWGHFHFSVDLFAEMCDLLHSDGGVPSHRFGSGPNWRMRTLKAALGKLELDPDLLHHGVGREIFLAPLAKNWQAFLKGETDRCQWYRFDLDDLAKFFRERWAVGRAIRDSSYLDFEPKHMRLGSAI